MLQSIAIDRVNWSAMAKCPHCTSNCAWHEVDETGPVLRCVCGYIGYLTVEKGGMKIINNQSERDLTLPRRGSKLSQCFGAVAAMWPQDVTTKRVADSMGADRSEVASQLAVLSHKGLIEATADGRGLVGGSTWKLTRRAIKVLNLR